MSGLSPRNCFDVLAALAEALAVVGEPGAALLDDPVLDAEVEQVAFARDALAVHDVELGLAERRRHLVLDDLDARAAADDLIAVLDARRCGGCRCAPTRRTSARGRRSSSRDCRT